MNSTFAAKHLKRIAETPGKNDKVSMVAQFRDDGTWCMVLHKALDPFTTYGIRAVPERRAETDSGADFNQQTWDLLWALSKRELTGHTALAQVQAELNRLSEVDAELLTNIIRKDLRAGFESLTVNKAIKGLIPEFPYMRCSLPKDARLAEWPWDLGVISQVKADGMFTNVNHEEDGQVVLTSRQGQAYPIDEFDELVDQIQNRLTRGTQSHGEIVVWRGRNMLPRAESNGVMNRVNAGGKFEGGEYPVLSLWDQIPLEFVVPKGSDPRPYSERFGWLRSQVEGDSATAVLRIIENRRVNSLKEAYAHYREELAKGYEGCVIKHPAMPWKDGTSKQQIKLKLDADCDLRIKGFNPGEGKNAATFGSVIVESACGLLEVSVSGFTDKMRQYIHENREALTGTVMTVKSNAILPPSPSNPKHSLFLPRFVELRKDKSVADDLQRIRDQFEAAIAAV